MITLVTRYICNDLIRKNNFVYQIIDQYSLSYILFTELRKYKYELYSHLRMRAETLTPTKKSTKRACEGEGEGEGGDADAHKKHLQVEDEGARNMDQNTWYIFYQF
jgi:hypothetical protein